VATVVFDVLATVAAVTRLLEYWAIIGNDTRGRYLKMRNRYKMSRLYIFYLFIIIIQGLYNIKIRKIKSKTIHSIC